MRKQTNTLSPSPRTSEKSADSDSDVRKALLKMHAMMLFLQSKLMQKLGDGAKPFTLAFPLSAPNSVLIRGEEGDTSAMGVSYDVRIHVADNSDDYTGAKKSSVHMGIRKVS
jgi:hypothetical protein